MAKKQTLRFPFPWRTLGVTTFAGVVILSVAIFSLLEPSYTFHALTKDTAGRSARDPKMKPLEDQTFAVCCQFDESECYALADKLDKGSVMDLKYRLARTGYLSGAVGRSFARPNDPYHYRRIMAHLAALIVAKSQTSPAR